MRRLWMALAALLLAGTVRAQSPDLLSFAHGAVPVRVEGDAAARVTMEQAIRAIDGSSAGFALTRPVPASTRIALVYALPAATVFEQFAVPDVLETPSPRQTFVREVSVWGSAQSSREGFVKLASATLVAHAKAGQQAALAVHRRDPVRWVRVELSGGLDVPQPPVPVTLSFSEIVGTGRQDTAPLATGFAGAWKGRGLTLELQQKGPAVSGCYDNGEGRLQGTVEGQLLRAAGQARRTGVPSTFVASLADEGGLQVMRSTNGAPFYLFEAKRGAAAGTACDAPERPKLGCGSVIHGIRFDFDSATLRPDSEPVLAALFDGLHDDRSVRIDIEGHTSSEGEAAYNQQLSQRRAQAVVDDLVRRGLPAARLQAKGAGESRPVAGNDDEIGRSLNRRVEVRCVE